MKRNTFVEDVDGLAEMQAPPFIIPFGIQI